MLPGMPNVPKIISWFQHFGHQSFLLSLLMGMIKHPQSTQSNKIAISLQYLTKELRDGVHFLHADEHQSFYKLRLSFSWWKWLDMSKVSKEKSVACVLLWCKIFKHFTGIKFCLVLLVLSWDHPFSTYAKFSEKLTFLTPRYAHVRVRIRR